MVCNGIYDLFVKVLEFLFHQVYLIVFVLLLA